MAPQRSGYTAVCSFMLIKQRVVPPSRVSFGGGGDEIEFGRRSEMREAI